MANAPHAHPSRLGDGSLLTQDADEGLGHVVPVAVYKRVLAGLLILTIITVAVSRFDFGMFNIVVAIGIASIKAALVAAWFMHLKFEKRLVIAFALYPLVILSLLIGGSLADVVTRTKVEPVNFGSAAQ